MARNPLRRTGEPETDETPVVLPHVVVAVGDTGTLDVTVDGQPFESPPGAEPWTRAGFADVLDTITGGRSIAVRVEVRESDGSVFTDIIRAHKPRPPTVKAEPVRSTSGRHAGRGRREPVEVTGAGFTPGEPVAVALIIAHTNAASTGDATALVDRTDARGTEVMLIGRTSGAICLRRVP